MNARTICHETEPTGDRDPWSAFLALDEGGPAVLLDSARFNPRIGRYSIVATRPVAIWQARGRSCTYTDASGARYYDADPPADLRRILLTRRAEPAEGIPPFTGGAIGVVSYEARHAFERLPCAAIDDLGTAPLVYPVLRRGTRLRCRRGKRHRGCFHAGRSWPRTRTRA